MSLLVTSLVAAAQPAQTQPAQAPPPQLEFVAGRAVRGRWRMNAFTAVRIEYLPPTIASQRCSIAGPGLRVAYATGGGDTIFEIGGVGHGYANADIIGFEIGGIEYEARIWTDQPFNSRYRDVDYPGDFVDSRRWGRTVGAILAVRRGPEYPWLSHVSLIDNMIAVPAIGIRYRRGGGERRARLSTAGFGAALRWCEEAFESDRARRLPARLRRIILR